jgi:hypothetical protein
MDPRFEAILAEQLGAGLPGLAGSDARVTIRVADDLLNRIVAASLPRDGAVKSVTITPAAGDAFAAVIALARPAFLPPIHARLTIERQPALPADPTLVLRLTGGAGSLLKLAGPMFGGSLPLPPFVRLEHDLVYVDVRALAATYGQSSHLRYARILRVTTDERVLIVTVVAAV